MLPTPCQKQSGTILRSPPAAWPRGHSQQGLGLLPEKASYSLWEGFPLPGWKGWLKGVRQSEPCPATSLLSGCLSCQLEIRSLHKHTVMREAFPKVTSCRLAASSRGLILVQSWTEIILHPQGVSLFLTSSGHKPEQLTCELPHGGKHSHKAPTNGEGDALRGGDMPSFRVMLWMCDSLDGSQTSSLQIHPRAACPHLQDGVVVRIRLTTPSLQEGIWL